MNKIGDAYQMQSKQWLAALAASLAMINVGNEEFWILRTFKNMRSSDSALRNDRNFIWVGLLVAAASSVIGAIFGAVLADRFGRRKTLLMTSIFTISQIVSGFTTNSALSCVTLLLGLIGLGMTRVAVPLFISEIVDDNIRGTLLMLQLPFFYIGKLIAVGIGKLVSAEIVGVITLILTSIFLITFTWLPETPYYLASKKRNNAATKSLTFYRGTESLAAGNEIDEILKNHSEGCCGKIQELVRPANRKGLIIVMFLMIITWDEQILDTTNDLIHVVIGTLLSSEDHARIIAHAASLIISILIVFIIDVIGRRSFLLFSHFIGFMVAIVAVILIISGIRGDDWLHFALGVAWYFYQLIFFAISLVYLGEMFSSNVKALAIGILTTIHQLTSFIIILLPEFMEVDVTSYINGILVLIAFPITFAFIPETKRKSFSDIQNELATTLHCRWLIKKLTRK